MKRAVTSKATWVALAAVCGFWGIAPLVDAGILRDIFNNIRLGVSVTVAFVWAAGAWHAYREGGADDGPDQLVIAVFLLYLVLAFQGIFAIVSVSLGRPAWLLDGPVGAFVPYMMSLVGLLFLSAPGLVSGAPKRQYWSQILMAVAIGGLVAGIMIGQRLPLF